MDKPPPEIGGRAEWALRVEMQSDPYLPMALIKSAAQRLLMAMMTM